jgi:hypothetical protein
MRLRVQQNVRSQIAFFWPNFKPHRSAKRFYKLELAIRCKRLAQITSSASDKFGFSYILCMPNQISAQLTQLLCKPFYPVIAREAGFQGYPRSFSSLFNAAVACKIEEVPKFGGHPGGKEGQKGGKAREKAGEGWRIAAGPQVCMLMRHAIIQRRNVLPG